MLEILQAPLAKNSGKTASTTIEIKLAAEEAVQDE
jgi:hypothetical protein